jgi:hypothetical protein
LQRRPTVASALVQRVESGTLAKTGAGVGCNRTVAQKVEDCGVDARRVQRRVLAAGVERGWNMDKIAV